MKKQLDLYQLNYVKKLESQRDELERQLANQLKIQEKNDYYIKDQSSQIQKLEIMVESFKKESH